MNNLKEINEIMDIAYKFDKIRYNLFEDLVNYDLSDKDYNKLFKSYEILQNMTNILISKSWDLYNAYYGNFEVIGKLRNETNINKSVNK